MALERLIRKESPETLAPARILAIDIANRKIQGQLRDTTVWAACDASLAGSLAIGDDVLFGRSGTTHFLVNKVPKTSPTQTVLMEV